MRRFGASVLIVGYRGSHADAGEHGGSRRGHLPGPTFRSSVMWTVTAALIWWSVSRAAAVRVRSTCVLHDCNERDPKKKKKKKKKI